MEPKICFITAIYGSYETSCKPFSPQTVSCDFICFTDNPNIQSNGWRVDTHPYHVTHNFYASTDHLNSIKNNKHTFNLAKYYKQFFFNIPCLSNYDHIIWLDGTIEITNSKTAEEIAKLSNKYFIVGWHHEGRKGSLIDEVKASLFDRYTSNHWFGQYQPIQDVVKHYSACVTRGYREFKFKEEFPNKSEHFGIWITCFVCFNMKAPLMRLFLEKWYLDTLMYSTQDQISFPFVCQYSNITPYTLPDNNIKGQEPHKQTDFYLKHGHGQ